MKPQLSIVVNPETGEATEGCPHCADKDDLIETLNRKLNGAWSAQKKAENERDRVMGLEPGAADILEVLGYWRQVCAPKASLVVGSKRWTTVRDRLKDKDASTGNPCFSVLSLKAAVIGIKLSAWHMAEPHRKDPALAFGDAGKVEALIGESVLFKRTYGESALGIVDELAGASLVWLAERCSCGCIRLEHVRQGPTPDGRQPCSRCGILCQDFDRYAAELERKWAELQQSSDPADQRAVADGRWGDRRQADRKASLAQNDETPEPRSEGSEAQPAS